MAKALSESSSSSASSGKPASSHNSTTQYRSFGRKRDAAFAFEETPLTQVRLNQLVAEAFHGESSSELKDAELNRANARGLHSFGIHQASDERRRPHKSTRRRLSMRPIDTDERETRTTDETWDTIQEYGDFLRDTANNVSMDSLMSPLTAQVGEPTQRTTLPDDSQRISQATHISPFDFLTWRNFHFYEVFSHLAPLTVGENQLHARQSGKLIDWISDLSNDSMFGGWSGLSQAVSPSPRLEDARRRQDYLEQTVLRQILDDGHTAPRRAGELGWKINEEPGGRKVFADFLLQEHPGRQEPASDGANVDTSKASSVDGSENDTPSVVSHDNHWRRTIFG
jgi:hypothetical protein